MFVGCLSEFLVISGTGCYRRSSVTNIRIIVFHYVDICLCVHHQVIRDQKIRIAIDREVSILKYLVSGVCDQTIEGFFFKINIDNVRLLIVNPCISLVVVEIDVFIVIDFDLNGCAARTNQYCNENNGCWKDGLVKIYIGYLFGISFHRPDIFPIPAIRR